jgi:hypothetical protein
LLLFLLKKGERLKQAKDTDPPEPTQDESIGQIIPLRGETVLSRYPLHNVAKKAHIRIKQTKRNARGKIETVWEVTHPPGPLSYKIDKAIIDKRIDEMRRNGEIRRLFKIGSLREICDELGIANGGSMKNAVRAALRENAFAGITCKLRFVDNDGAERLFEFDTTRYTVIYTGEKLPNGQRADAVYIELHPRYHELLRVAQTRPLDYKYLRDLPPAAQRLYELVSFGIFGSLKHSQRFTTMLYSVLCESAPLTRYSEWDKAKKQLYKIHKPHIDSGYLAKVEYQKTADAAGAPDWLIKYFPGPKARRVFREFTKTAAERREERAAAAAPRLLPAAPRSTPADVAPGPDRAGVDEDLVRRLMAVGFNEQDAQELATAYPESSRRELELWPYRDKSKMRNPPGFLRDAIEKGNYTPPPDIEKAVASAEKRQKAEQEAAEQKAREDHREKFADAYYDYLRPERERIKREHAEEYKKFADFISAQRLPENISRTQRDAIELSFFEEFVEERPELSVMTFSQWDTKRTQQ